LEKFFHNFFLNLIEFLICLNVSKDGEACRDLEMRQCWLLVELALIYFRDREVSQFEIKKGKVKTRLSVPIGFNRPFCPLLKRGREWISQN